MMSLESESISPVDQDITTVQLAQIPSSSSLRVEKPLIENVLLTSIPIALTIFTASLIIYRGSLLHLP
jgi:hypothetical protein